MEEPMSKEEMALRHILGLLGNTDHSQGNGPQAAKLLNAIRDLANVGLGK